MLTLNKLKKYAQRKVDSYGSEPVLFSFFITIFSVFTIIITPLSTDECFTSLAIVYTIAFALCTGLLLETKWPNTLKPYFSLYWFFTLLYCLPFTSTVYFFNTKQDAIALIGLAVAILLLILLVDWQSFFLITTLGIGCAIVFFKIVNGHYFPLFNFSTKWGLILGVSSATLIGFLFARRKELYDVNRLLRTRLYAGSIAHETKNYLSTTLFAGNRINQVIQKGQFRPLSKGDLYSIPKDLAEDLMGLGPDLALGARQSATKIDLFMQVLKEDILRAKLVVGSVKDCVEKALEDGYFDQEEVRKGLLLRLENDFNAKVHPGFFKHIICNLVKNAYDHGNATKVVLTLDAERRRLCVEDNGRGVEAESLPYVFDLFYSGGKGKGSGVGLALVKFVVEGFYGSVHCDSKQGDEAFTRFTIAFPELDS